MNRLECSSINNLHIDAIQSMLICRCRFRSKDRIMLLWLFLARVKDTASGIKILKPPIFRACPSTSFGGQFCIEALMLRETEGKSLSQPNHLHHQAMARYRHTLHCVFQERLGTCKWADTVFNDIRKSRSICYHRKKYLLPYYLITLLPYNLITL